MHVSESSSDLNRLLLLVCIQFIQYVRIRLLGDTELAVSDYIGSHVDDRIESIDFKGKRVTFDEIIEADNSVKFNMTGYFGQLLAKLGIHHLKPKHENDEIITCNKGDGEMHQLWCSTVEIPGFDAHGPVHPSPEDPCKSLITRDRVKDIVKDRPLRGVYFDNKRDAHNAALREAHRLFMDYVRSKSVAMHE